MYITSEKEVKGYTRLSKLGVEHAYYRTRTNLIFRCDSCSVIFTRQKGEVDSKRLNNNYFHCCSNCDAKRFAQKKGAEKRTIWDWHVSSDLDISKL